MGEEAEAQKREGPHPVSPSQPVAALALEPRLMAYSPRPTPKALPWVGVGEARCVPIFAARNLGSALCGHHHCCLCEARLVVWAISHAGFSQPLGEQSPQHGSVLGTRD